MLRGILAKSVSVSPKEAERHGLTLNKDGQRRTAFELLSYPNIELTDLAKIWPAFGELAPKTAEQLEIDAKYARLSLPAGGGCGGLPARRELRAAG